MGGLAPEHRAGLVALLGADGFLAPESLDAAEYAAWGADRARGYEPRHSGVALPRSVAELQALVRFANERGIALTPSGGRTGLVGGAAAIHGEIVVALSRMNRVLGYDPYLPALRLEAGVITADAQRIAAEHGRLFPLDLAASGSSQIGGNLATNAGGIRVIGYGGLRDYVVGLTVVTGAGALLQFPGGLLKNNVGYDLKQLFIGSEGTLGIIAEATIRLAEPIREPVTALVALADLAGALQLLELAREAGLRPLAFEFFDAAACAAVCAHLELPAPFAAEHPCYALLEWDRAQAPGDAEGFFFERALEAGLARDAAVAESSSGRASFWKYREGISESLSRGYVVHKHDLSAPIAVLPEFCEEVRGIVDRGFPGFRPIFFGHAGDGNVHLNLVKTPDCPDADFRARLPALDAEILGAVQKIGGSISAEHGLGLLKRNAIGYTRSEEEIRLMREIKSIFDPAGILNPGKVLPEPDAAG